LFAKQTPVSKARESWAEDGFLILPACIAPEKIDAYVQETHTLLAERASLDSPITIDVLEGARAGERLRLSDADDEVLGNAYKINDHYLDSKLCLSLALDASVAKILNELLGRVPVAINSLTFEKGSQQPLHFDTYYMPPPTANGMAVVSVCLEDQSAEAGPISYFPGSHKIAPYRFSHGGLHAVPDEMEAATSYINQEIEARGLGKRQFIGKKGDVFIWHAQLYHGGEPILDPSATRKTLVVHFWGKNDVASIKTTNVGANGAMLRRPHPAVL